MDPIFLFTFGIGFLITLSIDIKKGKSLKKSTRSIVFALNGVTAILVSSAAFGYFIPMPTRLFHVYVTPWIQAWLGS